MSWWEKLAGKARSVFGSPAPPKANGCDHSNISLRQGTAEFEWFVARAELEAGQNLKHGAGHRRCPSFPAESRDRHPGRSAIRGRSLGGKDPGIWLRGDRSGHQRHHAGQALCDDQSRPGHGRSKRRGNEDRDAHERQPRGRLWDSCQNRGASCRSGRRLESVTAPGSGQLA
jgi:hypothetical protein